MLAPTGILIFNMKKIYFLFCLVYLICFSVFSAAYTNTTSGLFSSGATWIGGVAPSSTLDSWAVATNTTLIYDVNNRSTAGWGPITVNGSLLMTNDCCIVLASNMSLYGTWTIGSYTNPIVMSSTNTPTVVIEFTNLAQCTIYRNSAINWYGSTNYIWNTYLSTTALLGTNVFTVSNMPPSSFVGEVIGTGRSGTVGVYSQYFMISSITGNQITVQSVPDYRTNYYPGITIQTTNNTLLPVGSCLSFLAQPIEMVETVKRGSGSAFGLYGGNSNYIQGVLSQNATRSISLSANLILNYSTAVIGNLGYQNANCLMTNDLAFGCVCGLDNNGQSGLILKNCVINNCSSGGAVGNCGGRFYNCTVNNTSNGGLVGTVSSVSGSIFVDNIFNYCTAYAAVNGGDTYYFTNNILTGCSGGLCLNSYYSTFVSNTIYSGVNGGLIVGATRCIFLYNTAVNCSGGGLVAGNSSYNNNAIYGGNIISNCVNGGILNSGGSVYTHGSVFTNNLIINCLNGALLYNSGTGNASDGCTVNNNTFINCTNGVLAYNLSDANRCVGWTVNNNNLVNCVGGMAIGCFGWVVSNTQNTNSSTLFTNCANMIAFNSPSTNDNNNYAYSGVPIVFDNSTWIYYAGNCRTTNGIITHVMYSNNIPISAQFVQTVRPNSQRTVYFRCQQTNNVTYTAALLLGQNTWPYTYQFTTSPGNSGIWTNFSLSYANTNNFPVSVTATVSATSTNSTVGYTQFSVGQDSALKKQ